MLQITTKFKSIIAAIILVIVLGITGLYFLNKDDTPTSTSFSEDETIIYSGDENAENEILLVFDYSCSWCHTWLSDIYPDVSKLIDEGIVKFRTQSLALLNNTSLQLTQFDQQIKEHYPDKYFDIFWEIIEAGNDSSYVELIEDQFFDKLITTNQLDKEILSSKPKVEATEITDLYTKNLSIESVPTIFVNGVKVEEGFDFNEIKKLLK